MDHDNNILVFINYYQIISLLLLDFLNHIKYLDFQSILLEEWYYFKPLCMQQFLLLYSWYLDHAVNILVLAYYFMLISLQMYFYFRLILNYLYKIVLAVFVLINNKYRIHYYYYNFINMVCDTILLVFQYYYRLKSLQQYNHHYFEY